MKILRRYLPLLGSLMVLAAATKATHAEEAWPSREDLVWTVTDKADFDRTLLGIDTLRLVLASAIFEGDKTVSRLAQGRDPYLTLRETIIASPKALAARFQTAAPEAIKLSDEVIAVVVAIEDITQSKGIVPESDLAHVMFAGLRIFLLSAQVNGTDVHKWMCGTYPFSVACK
ncbi:hypothetical protein [Microbaculum marinum]|uniref:Uncharacterized protein n=1 Tax=Microbaculum marinum TaxID=1764581 RepID=A0AAW9RFE3_9HYPH